MPFGLTPLHLLLALAVALIVLGPSRLPEAGAALGKALRGFRDAVSETPTAFKDAAAEPVVPEDAAPAEAATPPASDSAPTG